jgi:FkbM family methyltransferase
MDLLSHVLSLDEFQHKPPVLVDVGASGHLHSGWKKITKYSVCVAFDADKQAFEDYEGGRSKFRKLYTLDKIVAEKNGEKKFYITNLPDCSSTLLPDETRLKDWSFQQRFRVEQIAELETVSLPSVLSSLDLNYIDWFKTDSQGTDLRIFRSLDSDIISSILIAEFEPGIMDAYLGEDKMHQVMDFMEDYPFWLSGLNVKGPQRIRPENLTRNFNSLEQRFLSCFLKESAFWGEMIYINTFGLEKIRSKRNVLLGWVFGTLQQQHGFALELAQMGKSIFNDPLFQELEKASVRAVKRNYWKLPFYLLKMIHKKLTAF